MRRLIILISLIAAFEAADPGFRLDALKILGGNNRLNSELNYNGLNNGLNNYGLNSGFDRGNMMGMILGGSNLPNSMNSNNENNKNQFPQLLPMPNLPFTDGLNYRPQLSIPQPNPLPIPQEDYKKEDLNLGRILAPGRLAPLQIPQLPNILPQIPQKEESSGLVAPSFTANFKDSRSVSTFDFKQPLFNAPLASNNMDTNTNNMNTNMNNMNTNMNNMNNMNSMNNMNNMNNKMNNFMNNDLQLNGNSYNNLLGASSADKIPIEVSQFSTQITHDVPPRLQIQPPATLYGKGIV